MTLEESNKTKSNISEKNKSRRPSLCLQLCKGLFPDAQFPTEVILKNKNIQSSHSVYKVIPKSHHVLLSLQDKEFSI